MAGATPADLFAALRMFHAEYVQGRAPFQEYEVKRIALIDALTGTKYQPAVVAGGQTAQSELMPVMSVTPTVDLTYSYRDARLKDGMIPINRMEEATKHAATTGESTVQDWEIFHAAGNNNIRRLEQLVGQGVQVNMRDKDSGNTPLHAAASRGQRQALMWLVEHGADVNAQNHKGMTPLHILVISKQTNLCTWLVKQGADIEIEDARRFSPYDMALPWLQNELKEARDVFILSKQRRLPAVSPMGAAPAYPAALPTAAAPPGYGAAPLPAGPDGASYPYEPDMGLGGSLGSSAGPPQVTGLPMLPPLVPTEAAAAAPVETKVMKIYLKNNAYKTLMISSVMKAGDVCAMIAEKLGMAEFANSLELIDCIKSWPVIISTSEETNLENTCRLKVVPVRGCSETVAAKYRSAMYGK
jgi:hypothetical protein